MNTTFFRSWYLVLSLVLVAMFFVLEGFLDRADFLNLSGWVGLILMVIVMAYTLRKRLYQLKLSPETRSRVPLKKLERAEARLNEVRNDIRRGALKSRREIEPLVRRILREEKVARVLRVEVVEPEKTSSRRRVDPFVLHVGPTEPLGRVSVWLRAHLYLGLAFAVIVWLHGGGSLDSPMGLALNVLSLIVVVTGIAGIFLFSLGPSWITEKEKDLPYEKAFVYRQSLTEKIEGLAESLVPSTRKLCLEMAHDPRRVPAGIQELRTLSSSLEPGSRKDVQDLLVLLTQRERVSRALGEVWRIKFAINFWRLVHIPASVLLTGVVLAHVYSIWRY